MAAPDKSHLLRSPFPSPSRDAASAFWRSVFEAAAQPSVFLRAFYQRTVLTLLYARLRASSDIVIKMIPAVEHSFAPRAVGVAMPAAVRNEGATMKGCHLNLPDFFGGLQAEIHPASRQPSTPTLVLLPNCVNRRKRRAMCCERACAQWLFRRCVHLRRLFFRCGALV